jgi:hypothetical protein
MKTVKKYETFADLKASEKKTSNHTLSLKKHEEFEKIIKDFRSIKTNKNDNNRAK